MNDSTLKELWQQVAEKKSCEAKQKELTAQRDTLADRLKKLEKSKLAEQADVDRLEGHSLAAFFYQVIGKMDEKLDKERQEAYAARVKYDAALHDLSSVDADLKQIQNRLARLSDCESQYQAALSEKIKSIKVSAHPAAQQIAESESRIAALKVQKRELLEAINAGKTALHELHINEQEAEIVRLIFDKYVYEGYGAQRIATYLNNAGYRARSGKCWHPGSLRGMVGNLTYMGVLRCGDARSELIPELQIIPQEEFEAAQRIREDRSAHAAEEAEHHVPLRTRGQALLSNNVYCGHCGARLALTTSRKWRKLSDGTLDDTLRIRYTCYGKLRKQTNCTGQTGYTMHILDEIIDKMVRQIFSRLRGIPKEQLIISRYAKETAERKNHLQALQAERDKAEKDLLALKAEILAVIKGESAFPKDTLAEMIAAQEKKHTELETLCEEASAELERNAELMANVSQLYEELISYADLYDSASFEAKKMIVSQLIRRVDVYRGYQIHVDFNFDLAQYLENSDELAC